MPKSTLCGVGKAPDVESLLELQKRTPPFPSFPRAGLYTEWLAIPALITVCVYKSAQVLYASYLLPVIIRLYTHATIVQITEPNDQTAFKVTQTTFLLVTSRANYTISRFPINPIRLALNKLQPLTTPVHSSDYVTDARIRDSIEFARVFPPRPWRKIVNSELCFFCVLVCSCYLEDYMP